LHTKGGLHFLLLSRNLTSQLGMNSDWFHTHFPWSLLLLSIWNSGTNMMLSSLWGGLGRSWNREIFESSDALGFQIGHTKFSLQNLLCCRCKEVQREIKSYALNAYTTMTYLFHRCHVMLCCNYTCNNLKEMPQCIWRAPYIHEYAL
jgi:hypothetical protein